MAAQERKTTMSVSELRKILGLKKTESYWLVHKQWFETITVCGKMRIVIDSFEQWYANQVHYKKVKGEAPGRKIQKASFSVHDLSDLLGLTESTIRDLIIREKFTVTDLNHQWRISKKEFWEWYKAQNHYRTTTDRERDRKAEENTMTLPEMARMLCVSRNIAYNIVAHTSDIVVITIAGKKRVTKDSFEFWYSNQRHFKKYADRTPDEQIQILTEHKDDLLGKELREIYGIKELPQSKQAEKIWCTIKEASEVLGICESAVKRLIRRGDLKAIKANRNWQILKDDVFFLISQHKEH